MGRLARKARKLGYFPGWTGGTASAANAAKEHAGSREAEGRTGVLNGRHLSTMWAAVTFT
jgi:hypothetical protein